MVGWMVLVQHAACKTCVPRLLLAALLLALLSGNQSLAGEPAWIDQRQVGPFIVRATFDLKAYEVILDELPELERELRRVLALSPCKEPISILLLKDEKEHRDYLNQRFPGVPYRRALFVKQDGRATVFAYRHREIAVDLRHESTHALLHADLAMLPLWLDEGLAEYFEAPADQRAFGNPHARALRWNMQLGVVRGLEALEGKTELEELTRRDYQFAWAWTHFLLHGPREATEQLWDYLSSVRRGEPPGEMSARIEAALPGANRQLVRHFRAWAKLRVAARDLEGKAKKRE